MLNDYEPEVATAMMTSPAWTRGKLNFVNLILRYNIYFIQRQGTKILTDIRMIHCYDTRS